MLLLGLLLLSCGGKNKDTPSQADRKTHIPKSFEMVAVPSMMIDPGDRALYLVQHYWDRFDFTDTSYIGLAAVTEQAFVNFAQILAMRDLIPYTDAVAGIRSMLDAAQADSAVYRYFTDLYKKYFYMGNSPLMNDEYYIPALEHMLNSPHLDTSAQTSVQLDLNRIRRNLPGQRAEDFSYTLASGETWSLHRLRADFTLLVFNNPDCSACKEVQTQMTASPLLSELIRLGHLQVLALYPDADLEAWHKHRDQLPSAWINAYDQEQRILLNELYDLKAIPMLYLLDAQKNVLLRDCRVYQAEQYLGNIF